MLILWTKMVMHTGSLALLSGTATLALSTLSARPMNRSAETGETLDAHCL